MTTVFAPPGERLTKQTAPLLSKASVSGVTHNIWNTSAELHTPTMASHASRQMAHNSLSERPRSRVMSTSASETRSSLSLSTGNSSKPRTLAMVVTLVSLSSVVMSAICHFLRLSILIVQYTACTVTWMTVTFHSCHLIKYVVIKSNVLVSPLDVLVQTSETRRKRYITTFNLQVIHNVHG